MFKRTASSFALVAGMFFLMMPSQASATYECTVNPAICKAVCGKTVCGGFSAGNRDLRRMEGSASTQTISAQAASTRPGRAAGKGSYTCFNPAICRAVCGSATC